MLTTLPHAALAYTLRVRCLITSLLIALLPLTTAAYAPTRISYAESTFDQRSDYDPNGQLIRQTQTERSGTRTPTYTYDDDDRLISTDEQTESGDRIRTDTTLDGVGKRLSNESMRRLERIRTYVGSRDPDFRTSAILFPHLDRAAGRCHRHSADRDATGHPHRRREARVLRC